MKLAIKQRGLTSQAPFDATRALHLLVTRARQMALGETAPARYFLFVSPAVAHKLAPYGRQLAVELTRLLSERLHAAGLRARGITLSLRSDPDLVGTAMHAQAFAESALPSSGRGREIAFRPAGGGEPQRAPLGEGRTVIGRGANCDVTLDDPLVSKRHAEVVVTGDTIFLRDLGSRNGTFVNGGRLAEEPVLVAEKDEIRCGHTLLRLEEGG